jgi:hypothetical protein
MSFEPGTYWFIYLIIVGFIPAITDRRFSDLMVEFDNPKVDLPLSWVCDIHVCGAHSYSCSMSSVDLVEGYGNKQLSMISLLSGYSRNITTAYVRNLGQGCWIHVIYK